MALVNYTEEQKTEFCKAAEEMGIGRAVRALGYPTWATGQAWCNARGVTPLVDETMQSVKKYHTFYETEDALLIAEAGMERVRELLQEKELVPDDLKKAAEAYQKFTNQWLALQGRATSITETQKKDGMDLEIISLLQTEKKKQDHLLDTSTDVT